MKNFTRVPNGYSTREVDEYLQRIKQENETREARAREQAAKMAKMDKEIRNYRSQKEMLNRALKITSEIEKSARRVYDLEVQKVQLLYKKWESMLSDLRARFGGVIPTSELDNLMGDFKYDMTITLQSKKTPDGGRTYSQSVLEKMQHSNGSLDEEEQPETGFKLSDFTLEYDKDGNQVGGNYTHYDGYQAESQDELTPAQRFISGESVELPASYGAMIGNEFILPPKEFTNALEDSKKGFNIKDALSPKDSLESILRVLNIEGDESQEHGKLIKGRDKAEA